jgi:hypothetical protein
MPINIEQIKLNTTCPDCNTKNLVLGYSGNEGGIYKKINFLGADAFQNASGILRVICKDCGLIIKQYAERPEKL